MVTNQADNKGNCHSHTLGHLNWIGIIIQQQSLHYVFFIKGEFKENRPGIVIAVKEREDWFFQLELALEIERFRHFRHTHANMKFFAQHQSRVIDFDLLHPVSFALADTGAENNVFVNIISAA